MFYQTIERHLWSDDNIRSRKNTEQADKLLISQSATTGALAPLKVN